MGRGIGGNRYQINYGPGHFLAPLNTEFQMKFHLKAFCELMWKVRGTVFLAMHGKIF